MPSTLTAIGAYAFYNCTGLEKINLTEGLSDIPAYCFYNCIGLNKVVLPSTVQSVGNYAYYNCIGLRTITMNEGLKSIGSYAFWGCDGVLSLVLNEGLETISNNAFSNCDNLKAVELPSSITSIGANVFDGCSKLTIYCYSGSQAHMVGESEGYAIYLLDAHVHEYLTTVETAPTCTRGGSQILTCSICEYYYVDILEALGHQYADTVIAPNCEDNGYTLHTCSRCDGSYQDSFVSSTGHDYGEWETILDPSCTNNGIQKRICKTCEGEDEQVMKALGHFYEEVVIPPTCTGQGCTVYTCVVCNDSYGDDYVDPLEHSFGEWAVTKNPTILECGTRTRICSECSFAETEEIAKITVSVENNPKYGLANLIVVDAVTLKPVSGASIFITTENDGEATLVADADGKISQVLPVGQWPIAVYADGYMVRNLNITIEAGEQDIAPIGISDKPLVDAVITTREMTYEEMVEAGIDVNHKDNEHFYEYKVEIIFRETLDIMSFVSYGDGEGNIIHTTSNSGTSRTVYALSHDGDAVDMEAVTIVYSPEYGTYISDRSTYADAVWTPTLDDTISFQNNGYYFEGYGIPSTLTMTTNRAFPNDGWTFNSDSGRLSMLVGDRKHYLTFRDGEFCTVSHSEDSIPISLFERISSEGYPTGAEYVYIPAETFEAGKQYLLVQYNSVSINNREALSHDADRSDHETVTIHKDDVYGQYIVDSDLYENAVWLSSDAKLNGLNIVNNYYFAQVDENILKFMPLANENGWVLNDEYLSTTIGEETYYLRYANGEYQLTTSEVYAGKVMIFEKTTATYIVSGAGRTDTKIIYRRVHTFEAGKEYIIVGSGKNPSRGGGSGGGNGGGGYSGTSGGSFSGTLSNGTLVTIYPVSERFYLIIYGEVSWIKEMFDVEMLILNNSSTDTIENCVAELILPEGLSLAAMTEGEQSAVQLVDHIPENGSHSLHWYVRGDQEGIYNITATLSGTMMPFKENFYYEYEADSPIKVYAGSAMKMTIHIPEAAYKGIDYVVKFELENVSDKVLYGVTHAITGWEQGKITYYSDGSVVREEYGSGALKDAEKRLAFYPGDKIVMEVSFDILFESSIINNLLDQADQAEELYEAYKAVKTAYDMTKGLSSFCSSASSALNGILKANSITDSSKREATKALIEAFDELIGLFEEGDSKAVEMANNIQSSDLYEIIKECSTAGGCGEFIEKAESATAILSLADKIRGLLSEEEETESAYDAFGSLRTMISNLPIRYVVERVMVSTIGDSTTTIPHEVVLTPVGSPYMGVDSWGKYIYNWTITAMGKISSPWYVKMFGGSDDISGYEDAVDYVKQVEKQIAAYSVHKDADTKFRARVESASAVNGISINTVGSQSENFLIETDNETAVFENGVLTFTGNAILEVTALSTEDGILYIEDDEGNVKTIVIDTVEAHTCHSDEWHVEIAPSEEFDGYRAKCCDICGDTIAIETLTSCGEHIFGNWTVEREATEVSVGIQYRECQNCYARETEYLISDKPDEEGPEAPYYDLQTNETNVADDQTAMTVVCCKQSGEGHELSLNYIGEAVIGVGEVTGNENGGWSCIVTLNAATYMDAFNQFNQGCENYVEHKLADRNQSSVNLVLEWNAEIEKWDIREAGVITADCEPQEPYPEQPTLPDENGSNVIEGLIAILCESDGDRHQTVYGKWQTEHCRTISNMVWSDELGTWTVEAEIDNLDMMYVDQMEIANNSTSHELVENITSVYTTLKWDAEQKLWVTLDGNPIELHTICRTVPLAPAYKQLYDYQIKVWGNVKGEMENCITSITENSYTLSEVRGSREEGFFVDVTIRLHDADAYINAWIVEKAPESMDYVYDWDRTEKEYTFSLKYNGDLTGTLYGDRHSANTNYDWVIQSNSSTMGVIGEAYLKPDPTEVTVIFNWAGMDSYTQQMPYGETLLLAANTFDRIGYTFDHWNVDEVNFADGETLTAEQVHDLYLYALANEGNVNLNACWTANQYILSFCTGYEAENPANKTVTYDNAVGELPVLTRTGYTFEGWYDVEGNVVTAETVYQVADNTVLEAHWKANIYTICFDVGYETENPANKTVTYDNAVGELPVLSRIGYTFQGWLDAEGNPITADIVYQVAGDSVLTAHWEAEGWHKVDGKWFFYENGEPRTGWLMNGKEWYYMDAEGIMQIGWIKVGNIWYYMQSSGAMATGWLKISGVYYYFNTSGAMQTGWVNDGKNWYYMQSSGAMTTGWVKVGGIWYYLHTSGAMVTGWYKVGNNDYYFNEQGAMQTGWLRFGSNWYYMQPSGAMAIGWIKVGTSWYYMNDKGIMQTGWLKLGNDWYYLNNSGVMVTGKQVINGKTYQFNANGVWIF